MMKEKERFKELLAYLKENKIQWGIEIHGGKIWHAIMKFPDGIYARGYSVLADADRNLPNETKLIRGPLIALGRGLKAYNAKNSVAPVLHDKIIALLSSHHCPNGELLEPTFFKGQYRVLPSKSEEWLLEYSGATPNQQYGKPSYDPRVEPPKPISHWRDASLVDFIKKQIGNGSIEAKNLISLFFNESRNQTITDPTQKAEDIKKLFSDKWLEDNGFHVYTRKFVALKK